MKSKDDPAYQHEMNELRKLSAYFIEAHDKKDFFSQLLLSGMMLAQTVKIYKLSPPAGILDPKKLFD